MKEVLQKLHILIMAFFFLFYVIFLSAAPLIKAAPKGDPKINQSIISVLLAIKDRKITRANAKAKNIFKLSNHRVHIDNNGEIQIYIHMISFGEDVFAQLRKNEVKIEITNKTLAIVQGWAPFDRIEDIAALAFVRQIKPPNYGMTQSGSVTTEGDSILKADLVRQLGIDGNGVKVGVISDGANNWTTAYATGDLPANITVYGTCTPRLYNGSVCDSGITCNEGTAMLEIIHDIAPGAQLAVASAYTSLEFAQRIDELVNNFGADVIVDDLFFPLEPYFADGIDAQAVAAVANQTIYISAAGNFAQGHYEVNYLPDYSMGGDFHNFGQAAGLFTDLSMNILINPGMYVVLILQWNDEFGLSENDYDLFLINEAETNVLCPTCGGKMEQSGTQDPLEGICYYNNTNYTVRGKIVINRFSGLTKRLEMFVLGGQVEEYNIPDGSVFGHSGVSGALAIGAIDASDPGNDTIEQFSSRGPSRIDFPSVQNRPKPDLVAIDGVSVTGVGGFPSVFFGTSAAAPHAAGVAALLKQGTPATTPAMIRTALMSSAVDLGISGQDNIFGSGRVNAFAALMVIAPDSDNDGLKDFEEELTYLSDPNVSDTDGDGLDDGIEVAYWGTRWNADPDGDQLVNLLDPDSDNDGLKDGLEVNYLGTDPAQADTDGDNTPDGDEDNDGDGFTNLEEVQCEADPIDPSSRCGRFLPFLMLLLD